MTPSTTRTDKVQQQGYQRPAKIEAQIASLDGMPSDKLTERIKIRSPDHVNHILPETLVFLTRRALDRKDHKLGRLLVQELTGRCFKILLNQIDAEAYADQISICEDIISKFVELFAKDLAGRKTPLDFYECRFNRAFKGLRIDHLRTVTLKGRILEMPDDQPFDPGDSANSVDESEVEALRAPPNQETAYILSRIANALKSLPDGQRNAFVLVRLLGYKTHSKNPEEVTAAARCKCSDRTIRNRLKQADAVLAPLLEDLHEKS